MGNARLKQVQTVLAGALIAALLRLYIQRLVRRETTDVIDTVRGYVRAQLSLVMDHREGLHRAD